MVRSFTKGPKGYSLTAVGSPGLPIDHVKLLPKYGVDSELAEVVLESVELRQIRRARPLR